MLLYAAVEGSSPFRQDTPLSTLRAIVDEELPPPRRAGALTPVIEGLLRKDPAERLPAGRAEQELRLVGAGGAPRTGTAVGGACAPTVVAGAEPPGPAPPAPLPGPAPGDGTDGTATAVTAAGAGGRDRRAVVALVAGLAVLALALGWLAYALVDRGGGGGDGRATGGGRTEASEPEAGRTEPSREPSGEPHPSATTGGTGAQSPASSPPPQSVEVAVTGVRTGYAGTCPPPHAQAPAFTATFTVGRLPAEVVYRWVTRDGPVAGPDWRTLSFPADGGRSRQDTVVVTAYDEGGTLTGRIGVEVRDPVGARSDTVPFSVTCEEETPTGGASSPSSSGSASP